MYTMGNNPSVRQSNRPSGKEVKKHTRRETVADYYETVNIVKKSRLIPPELLNIIIDYAGGHPYYTIAERMKCCRQFNSFNEGIASGVTTFSYIMNCANTIAMTDICWNIKYEIPKALFVKGNYTMNVSFGGIVNMSGKCFIIERGDYYYLWSPDTSLPIPVLAMQHHNITIDVVNEFNVKCKNGIFSYEAICINRIDKWHIIYDSFLIAVYGSVFMSGMGGKNTSVHYSYNDQNSEIFPGIRRINDNYKNGQSPIK